MNWAAILALIICGTVVILMISSDYFDDCQDKREHEYRMALLARNVIDDADDEEVGEEGTITEGAQ